MKEQVENRASGKVKSVTIFNDDHMEIITTDGRRFKTINTAGFILLQGCGNFKEEGTDSSTNEELAIVVYYDHEVAPYLSWKKML